jgi:hypothetical protein
MVVILATVILALSLSGGPSAAESRQDPTVLELAGVWMLCYDPALNMGAHELDQEYLVLQPDGSYVSQSKAAIDNPVSSRLAVFGTYKITESGLMLTPKGLVGWDGRPEPGAHLVPRPLRYRREAHVVLFSDLNHSLTLPVLCSGEGLNWCYAKVF